MKNEINHLLPQTDLTCFVIRNLFSSAECDGLLSPDIKELFQQSNGYYPPFYRNNERLVVDDLDMSSLLFEKVKSFIPEIIAVESENTQEKGNWRLKELNNRFRYCRYNEGQYFSRHLDGIYYKSDSIQSKLTFMLYLNDAIDFIGGRTLFYKEKDSTEIWASYHPRKGDLIVFDHNIWHEGEQVITGNKYVLRSDILYERLDPSEHIQNVNYCEGHLGYIWKIIHFNEDLIISGGRDKIIKVWNKEGSCIQRLQNHQQSILCLAQINENIFVSGSRDKTICIWEKDVSFALKDTITTNQTTILAVCGLDLNTFACAGADGRILIHGLDKELKGILEGHQDWVWGLFKMNENILISWSEDATIRIWDLNTLECINTIQESCAIHALVFDHKNNQFIIGNFLGEIKIIKCKHDFSVTTIVHEIQAHKGIIRDLVMVSDDIIASGGEDNQIKCWKLISLENITNFTHLNFVQSLLSIEDKRLLSASYDGQIKIWAV